jgi:hypothetical protein
MVETRREYVDRYGDTDHALVGQGGIEPPTEGL